MFDWTLPSSASSKRCDVLLACDVLYEAAAVQHVVACLPVLLADGGTLLLADPPARTPANRARVLELLAAGQPGLMARVPPDGPQLLTVRDAGHEMMALGGDASEVQIWQLSLERVVAVQ